MYIFDSQCYRFRYLCYRHDSQPLLLLPVTWQEFGHSRTVRTSTAFKSQVCVSSNACCRVVSVIVSARMRSSVSPVADCVLCCRLLPTMTVPVPRPPGLLLSSTFPAQPLPVPQVPPASLVLAQARPCEPRLPLHVSGEAAGVHQGGARAPEGPLPVWYGDLVRRSLRTVPAAKSPPCPHASVLVVLLEHTFIDATGTRRLRPTRASGLAVNAHLSWRSTRAIPVVRRADPDWWLPPTTVPRLLPSD